MIYTIVGFRVDEKRSVYYGTAKTIEECLQKIDTAFERKEAQFISVRRIETKSEETKTV